MQSEVALHYRDGAGQIDDRPGDGAQRGRLRDYVRESVGQRYVIHPQLFLHYNYYTLQLLIVRRPARTVRGRGAATERSRTDRPADARLSHVRVALFDGPARVADHLLYLPGRLSVRPGARVLLGRAERGDQPAFRLLRA